LTSNLKQLKRQTRLVRSTQLPN